MQPTNIFSEINLELNYDFDNTKSTTSLHNMTTLYAHSRPATLSKMI